MPKTISQLPIGAATADWVLAADNQIGTITAKVLLKDVGAIGDQVGTWFPTLTGSTGTPTVTYTDRQGLFIRRGSHVTVWGRLRPSTITGGSGNALITGLPYRPDQRVSQYAGSVAYQFGWSSTPPTLIMAMSNTFSLQTHAFQASTLHITFTPLSHWTNSTLLVFSASYITADP